MNTFPLLAIGGACIVAVLTCLMCVILVLRTLRLSQQPAAPLCNKHYEEMYTAEDIVRFILWRSSCEAELAKCKKSLAFYRKIESATPQQDRWKLLKQSTTDRLGLTAPEHQFPTEILTGKIEFIKAIELKFHPSPHNQDPEHD